MDVDKYYEISAEHSISGAFALFLSLDFLTRDLLSTQKFLNCVRPRRVICLP